MILQPIFGLDVYTFKDDVVGKIYNNDWVKACEAVKQAVTFDNSAGTATVRLKEPHGPMQQILTLSSLAIVSKPWVAKQGDWNGDCASAEKHNDPTAEGDPLTKAMNGTGPYRFERWEPGQQISLVRNDNYWLKEPLWEGAPKGPAKIQRVTIKVMEEWSTRFAALQTGDADSVEVPRQYISQVDPLVAETCTSGSDGQIKCTSSGGTGALRVYKGLPTITSDVMAFNLQVNTTGGNDRIGSGKLDGNGVPPDFFSDIHVRKGFNYCFDWGIYIEQVFSGESQQALGPIIQGITGYDPNQAHYSFNAEKCAEEFKASTQKSSAGRSLWDTGFTLTYNYPAGSDQPRVAGEILKDNLAKVNPKFKLNAVEEPFQELLSAQNDSRMPLFSIGWQEDYHDPHNWVSAYLSSGGAFAGFSHFPADVQSRLDELVLQGIQTKDETARAGIYKELQNIAYENALYVFLTQSQTRRYEQRWVSGWYYNPSYPYTTAPGVYFYALSKSK
jgi:peptide/nickel transport system substrate-binding protein